MLRSDLCDFSHGYIVVTGNITVTKKIFTADDFEAPNNTVAIITDADNENNNAFGEKELVFKNNAPFINCVSKINGVKIDNSEDLHVVMPMHHLLEYSKNYKKTTGSLWNYYRNERNSNTDGNEKMHSILNSESCDYKGNLMENSVTQ